MIIDWERHRATIRFIGHYRWHERQPDYAGGLYDHMLWVITAGRGELRTPRGRFPLQTGRCVWFKPGVAFSVHQTRGRMSMYSIVFALRDERGRDRGLDWRLPADALDDPQAGFARCIAERLQHLAGEEHPHARASFTGERRPCADQLLTALLMELDRHNDRGEIAPPPLLTPVQGALYELVRSISADPASAPEPGEQARLLGISHTHLCRLYRQLFRLSPQHFAMRFRIRHARRLLAESDDRIGAIAEALGYRSAPFFSRQFRQHMGISRQEWRLRCRERQPSQE